MSSDYCDRKIQELERVLNEWEPMGYNGRPPVNQPMGHVPPPPPARRPRVAERPTSDLYGMPIYDSPEIAATRGISPVAQAARATAENVRIVEAAQQLAMSSGMSVETAMEMLVRASQIPATPAKNPMPIGTDLSKPRKRKITLE